MRRQRTHVGRGHHGLSPSDRRGMRVDSPINWRRPRSAARQTTNSRIDADSPNRRDGLDQSVKPPIDRRTNPGHRTCEWEAAAAHALHERPLIRIAHCLPAPAHTRRPRLHQQVQRSRRLSPFDHVIGWCRSGQKLGYRRRLGVLRSRSRTDCCCPSKCLRDPQEPPFVKVKETCRKPATSPSVIGRPSRHFMRGRIPLGLGQPCRRSRRPAEGDGEGAGRHAQRSGSTCCRRQRGDGRFRTIRTPTPAR